MKSGSVTRTLAVYAFVAFPLFAQHITKRPIVFSGTGLNDAENGGRYSGSTGSAHYVITISETGAPDHFQWWKDGGALSPAIAITGAPQEMSDGVTIKFKATTGHTANDSWAIVAEANQSTDTFAAREPAELSTRNARNERTRIISVRDFGAKGIAGAADDTGPIQNAINALPDGGTLYFPKPAKYYQITKGLQIIGRSTIRLRGAPGTEIRVMDGTTDVAYNTWPEFGQDSIFRVVDSSNITIDGLILNGNISNRTAHAGSESSNSAVLLAGSTNITIRNCVLREALTDGVLVMYDASGLTNTNIRIENNRILNNRRNNISGVAQNHLFIGRNAITGAGTIQGTKPESGIDIEPDYFTTQLSRDVHIEGNSITGSAGEYGVSAVGTAGLVLTGNRISANSGYGVNFEASFVGGFRNTDSALTGNQIFDNKSIGVRIVGRNLDLVSGNLIRGNSWGMQIFLSDGLLITGNRLESNANGGIVNGTTAPLGFLNLSIRSNTFRDNSSATGVANGAGWILMAMPASATATLEFDKNKIYGSRDLSQRGLNIGGPCQCRGSGNTAYNVQNPLGTFDGITGTANRSFGPDRHKSP
jgi:hypothetical protein